MAVAVRGPSVAFVAVQPAAQELPSMQVTLYINQNAISPDPVRPVGGHPLGPPRPLGRPWAASPSRTAAPKTLLFENFFKKHHFLKNYI